jgi:hypothetical protein
LARALFLFPPHKIYILSNGGLFNKIKPVEFKNFYLKILYLSYAVVKSLGCGRGMDEDAEGVPFRDPLGK